MSKIDINKTKINVTNLTFDERYALRKKLWEKYKCPCGESNNLICNYIYIHADCWFTDSLDNKFKNSIFTEISYNEL